MRYIKVFFLGKGVIHIRLVGKKKKKSKKTVTWSEGGRQQIRASDRCVAHGDDAAARAAPTRSRRSCVTGVRCSPPGDRGGGRPRRWPLARGELVRRRDEAQQGRGGALHRLGAGLRPVGPRGERVRAGRRHGSRRPRLRLERRRRRALLAWRC